MLTKISKSIGIVILLAVVLAIIILLVRFRSCMNSEATDVIVSTPVDTSFAPVIKRDYKPASTPFEKKSKPPARLPKGINTDAVKAILIITKNACGGLDTTSVIETKRGDYFVDKQGGKVVAVDLYIFKPPILKFGLFFQLGITIGGGISPVATICPLQIEGVLQVPVLSIDLFGIGAGMEYRFGNISCGALSCYGFQTGRQLKLLLTYNF